MSNHPSVEDTQTKVCLNFINNICIYNCLDCNVKFLRRHTVLKSSIKFPEIAEIRMVDFSENLDITRWCEQEMPVPNETPINCLHLQNRLSLHLFTRKKLCFVISVLMHLLAGLWSILSFWNEIKVFSELRLEASYRRRHRFVNANYPPPSWLNRHVYLLTSLKLRDHCCTVYH